MNIVIMGPKGAGKSTIGALLSAHTGFRTVETDRMIEDLHEARHGHRTGCRAVFAEHGEAFFRQLERDTAQQCHELDWQIVITGGSIMLEPDSRRILRHDALLVYLTGAPEALWERATANGLPPWLEGPDGKQKYLDQVRHREEVLRHFADIVIDTTGRTPETLADELIERISEELAIHTRSANTFGELIRMTTFGESHGPAIGAVLDGLRPGIPIDVDFIQEELDRRRPGQSNISTMRKEADKVHILSGVFEGKTTGAPVALVIYNQDQKSKSYDNIKGLFRPGHADFTFYRKYGIRDYRGGGRSSGRETATRVATGAIAKQILAGRGVTITAHTVEIAGISANTCDYSAIEQNPVRCADPEAAKAMEAAIVAARKDMDSVGGIIQVEIDGVPPGLGDPVFAKLDARLAAAVMTIGAIKGIEVGGGFALARLRGSGANDNMDAAGFLSNNHGGILGGISTGEKIVLRLVVKPTSSIARKQKTIDTHGDEVTCEVFGRHDPCITPRAVPVTEHMAALTLLDVWEVQSRLRPEWAAQWGTVGQAGKEA